MTDPTIDVSVEAPNETGLLYINLSQAIRLPDGYTSWSSENEGSSIFALSYIPTEETKTTLYDRDVSNTMKWSVSEGATEVDQLIIQLEFEHKDLVSQLSKDELHVIVFSNLLSAESTYTLNSGEESDHLSFSLKIEQQFSFELIETIADVT